MKIGFVSMPLTGHVNPMTALARRLQRRGHEIVFLGFPDTERSVLAAGLNFVSFGEEEFPVGSVAKAMAPWRRPWLRCPSCTAWRWRSIHC
jgi:zeaxanthin glucosyltransferase